ncbi:MAG: LytR/AlgR family response regulator transcription factor [Saprospiraceae bacterium]
MIKCFIVDDEPIARRVLKNLCEEYCENVEVLGTAGSVDAAIPLIQNHQPDLVFLDIRMPMKDGFTLLDAFPNRVFDVIFTTAYDDYAVQAFQSEAMDYITKPIDIDDLDAAIKKVKPKERKESFDSLKIRLAKEMDNRIIFNTSDGKVVFPYQDIIRFEAFGNYLKVFTIRDNKVTLVIHTLKEIEGIIPAASFFRIHKSHFINFSHIKKFVKDKGLKLLMADDTLVEVSVRKRDELIQKILG